MRQSNLKRTSLKFRRRYYHRASHIELIRGGKQFFDLLEKLIDEARVEIHIQYYICEADETGNTIMNALIRAAKRNVAVFFVLDAYGSSKLPELSHKKMIDAGINFKWFRPVICMGNMEFGRRMHHKAVAIDEQVSLVTGVNIANRYNDINGEKAWLDFALLVKGIPAKEVKQRCLQIWEKTYKITGKWRKFRLPIMSDSIQSHNALVKVSVNDWLRGRNEIYTGYRNAFQKAEKEIQIVGGYFLPGRNMRRKLREASKRGVNISVILTRVSDVMFAKSAEKYLYNWMFQNDIKIYEWQQTVMHGKVAVVDQTWSTVGSYNLNYLSNFESIELNMEIIDNGFSRKLSELLSQISREECTLIDKDEFYRHYSFMVKLQNRFSYWIARTLMRVLSVFTKKPSPN